MKQRKHELLKELVDLVSQLSFTAERADLREGVYWLVYAHPWVGEDERYFDALISITPLQPEVGTGQGVRVVVQSGNVHWLADGADSVTNQRGQAWFKQLSVSERFTARAQIPSEEEAVEPALVDEPLAAAPAAMQPRGAVQALGGPRSEPCIFYLSDHRLVALLEEGTGGRTVLTVETEASEFAGTTVRFELGQETGEVMLTPTDPPGAWSGQHVLRQPFQAVKIEIPTFTLVPSQEGVSKQ